MLPDDRVAANWFTYLPDDSGHQAWMTGDGHFDEDRAQLALYQPTGTGFGRDFDSNDVEVTYWGELEIVFDDVDHGRVIWNSDFESYGSDEYPIERIASPQLADCEP